MSMSQQKSNGLLALGRWLRAARCILIHLLITHGWWTISAEARDTLDGVSETEGVLYTRATGDFYKTYPGMHVRNPLKITV